MTKIDSKAAESLVSGISIPPRPAVLQAVLAEQNATHPDLNRISRAISTDVSLSASILKAVNSPLYGLRSKVNSVQHGVMMLGLKNVVNLVTGLSLRQAIKGGGKISLDRFWDTAADTAMISRSLSRELFVGDPEDAYLLGLFHDCGIPLMMMKFPNYVPFLRQANNDPSHELTELEDQAYNTNHAVIGYFVAQNWRLPDRIASAVQRHHDLTHLQDRDDPIVPLIYTLILAEHISHRVRRLTMDYAWERIKHDVLNFFELDGQQFETLIADMATKLTA